MGLVVIFRSLIKEELIQTKKCGVFYILALEEIDENIKI